MFNDDCDVFDISPDNADHDRTDNTVWDLVAPSIAQDDALTNKTGFSMLQDNAEGKQSDARCSGTAMILLLTYSLGYTTKQQASKACC